MRQIWTLMFVVSIGCELDTATAWQHTLGCTPGGCDNSDETVHYNIKGLRQDGVPNREGVEIESWNGRPLIRKPGAAYYLEVSKSKVFGIDVTDPSIVIAGDQLVGAHIQLMFKGQPLYTIDFHRWRRLPFPNPDHGDVDVFHLSWSDSENPLNEEHKLCNGEPPWNIPKHEQPYILMDMLPDEAMFFEGDEFDFDRLRVEPGYRHEWVNFGCAGRALAKLHLTGHTNRFEPNSRLNTAVLKMYTADYFGVGFSFTHTGAKISWRDPHMELQGNPTTLEARWSEEGAICVNTPRMKYDPLGDTLFPPTFHEFYMNAPNLLQRPAPPGCANLNLWEDDGELVLSANRL